MEILIFMNVSNNDNLATDSGYKFYNILAKEIIAAGHCVTFIGPAPIESPLAKYSPMNFGSNKYEFRFLFDMQKVSTIIQNSNPDIIIVNQIELVPHFHICLEKLNNTKAKIVGYVHYIPYSLNVNGNISEDASLNARGISNAIIHAFISGLEMCECVFVHSKTALEIIKAGCYQLGRKLQTDKIVIAPPPCDPFLIEEPISRKLPSRNIVYNHRLYAHYGTEQFIQLIPSLLRLNTHITVLDILSQRSLERKSMDTSPDQLRQKMLQIDGVIVLDGGAHGDRYRSLLKEAGIGFAPLRANCTWSMSCIDLMSMGKPVVAPNTAWFKEFIPAPLLFSSHDQACSIVSKLFDDKDFYTETSVHCYEKTKALIPNNIAQTFLGAFKNLIEKSYADRVRHNLSLEEC